MTFSKKCTFFERALARSNTQSMQMQMNVTV